MVSALALVGAAAPPGEAGFLPRADLAAPDRRCSAKTAGGSSAPRSTDGAIVYDEIPAPPAADRVARRPGARAGTG